jgi:hypothetical protein
MWGLNWIIGFWKKPEGEASEEMDTLATVAGLSNVEPSDLRVLYDTATSLGLNPDHLAAIESFESAKTFSPSVQNPRSHATGVIQFYPNKSGMTSVGVTIDQLKAMSFAEQHRYVAKYFKPFGPLPTLQQAYMAVFNPGPGGKFVHTSDLDTIVARKGEPVYDLNPAFDPDNLGFFTVRQVVGAVQDVLSLAKSKPRTPVPPRSSSLAGSSSGGIGDAILVAAIAYLAHKLS